MLNLYISNLLNYRQNKGGLNIAVAYLIYCLHLWNKKDFKSIDSFTRAFERINNANTSNYRLRFGAFLIIQLT